MIGAAGEGSKNNTFSISVLRGKGGRKTMFYYWHWYYTNTTLLIFLLCFQSSKSSIVSSPFKITVQVVIIVDEGNKKNAFLGSLLDSFFEEPIPVN